MLTTDDDPEKKIIEVAEHGPGDKRRFEKI